MGDSFEGSGSETRPATRWVNAGTQAFLRGLRPTARLGPNPGRSKSNQGLGAQPLLRGARDPGDPLMAPLRHSWDSCLARLRAEAGQLSRHPHWLLACAHQCPLPGMPLSLRTVDPLLPGPFVAMATPRLLREGQSLFVVVQSLFEGQWGYSPWEPVANKPLGGGGETGPLNPLLPIIELRKLGQESLRVRGCPPHQSHLHRLPMEGSPGRPHGPRKRLSATG